MQHLVTFRRAVLERNSVRIGYTSQGKEASLQYDRTGFLGDEAIVTRQLREIYCANGLNVTKFMDGDHSRRPRISAVTGIIHSLNDFQIDQQTQLRLMYFLHRLPPIIVKLAPLNRAGFDDFTPYIQLHQLMISNGECDMASYVKEAENESEQLRRMRVFLACFCLGLIAPHKGSSSASKNASVLHRIIKRIRKL